MENPQTSNQIPKHHYIQYGKQTLDESDVQAMAQVLRENQYLTTGPRVTEFEDKVKEMTGTQHAIAVNSGTAALHAAMYAINIQPGDEVIVPTLTFSATANCVVYQNATPIFCDIEPDTLNIDPNQIKNLINKKTRAVIMVDYAGQPANYHQIIQICREHKLYLIQDSAHTIGLQVTKCPTQPYVGNIQGVDITCFSFHPVKNMTTGEGGMCTTNNPDLAKRMQRFRTHGITTEYQNRALHAYDIPELGFNYRITDFQCALGTNQLKRLPQWIKRRQEIAAYYDQKFKPYSKLFAPLTQKYDSAYHLYVIKLNLEALDTDRDQIFQELKDKNIGVNVHYVPVPYLTYYQNRFKNPEDSFKTPNIPITDKIYQEIITLPIFPTLTQEEIDWVVQDVIDVMLHHRLEFEI